ncbi:tetratricopeptide repeat protein 19 homolog, mitochondrial [Manduca sexta]|uniref:tetratricopeptide repeat protein 19 homolog, mitochondrial n=1 Tax=Manduca sexta TaxID=7130 RepID=UPI00188E7AB7|nr:tetratricopeptide repeat protein 19 homolog, mitochondrial [Manduca sexta]
MAAKYKHFWNRWTRLTRSFTPIPKTIVRRTTISPVGVISVPCMMGFSLFTWLGFEKKATVEDELIHTIKHCVLFIQRTEYEKAEKLLHVALRQAQQLQHQLGITYIYDVMANLALEREQLDKAKQLFVVVTQRIMQDGATEDDFRVVHISAKLARISHLKKEYETAQIGYDWCLQKLNEAVKEEPTDDRIKLLALTEDWYGRMYLEHNQYEQALKMMVSSLNRMKQVSEVEKEHIALQLNDIGTVCDHLKRTDESIDYFKEAIAVAKPLEMDYLGLMYINLGRAYLNKKLIDDARKNCGFAWRLGVMSRNEEIKKEAESCMNQIKNIA